MANGKVALQRGPVVYCLEEADNPIVPLSRIALPRQAELATQWEPDLLGGVVTISGNAQAIEMPPAPEALYTIDPLPPATCRIKAVPYYAWDNRAPGQMLVWLREA